IPLSLQCVSPTCARRLIPFSLFPFFIKHTPTPEIYTLSLHDALPICSRISSLTSSSETAISAFSATASSASSRATDWELALEARSEEHTSELQSLTNLVCRLLLEKKKPPRQSTLSATPSNYQPTNTLS